MADLSFKKVILSLCYSCNNFKMMKLKSMWKQRLQNNRLTCHFSFVNTNNIVQKGKGGERELLNTQRQKQFSRDNFSLKCKYHFMAFSTSTVFFLFVDKHGITSPPKLEFCWYCPHPQHKKSTKSSKTEKSFSMENQFYTFLIFKHHFKVFLILVYSSLRICVKYFL